MSDEHEEGWYSDPFGRHEARWMSQGVPTKLVRDGELESYDEPPDEEPSHEAVRLGEESARPEDPYVDRDGSPLNQQMEQAAEIGEISSVPSERLRKSERRTR